MKKKAAAIILSVILSGALLAGCGSGAKSTGTDPAPTAASGEEDAGGKEDASGEPGDRGQQTGAAGLRRNARP